MSVLTTFVPIVHVACAAVLAYTQSPKWGLLHSQFLARLQTPHRRGAPWQEWMALMDGAAGL